MNWVTIWVCWTSYPSDNTLREHPDAPVGKRWVNNQFGLMGLAAYFAAPEDDPRLAHVWNYRNGYRSTAYDHHLKPRKCWLGAGGNSLGWTRHKSAALPITPKQPSLSIRWLSPELKPPWWLYRYRRPS